MKKFNLLVILLCLLLSFSCSKENEVKPSEGNDITAIHLKLSDGSTFDYPVVATETNLNLDLVVPINTDPSKISMNVDLPKYAEVESSVKMGEPMDFSKPITFTVIAGDGAKKKYTVNVNFIANDKIPVKVMFGEETTIETESSGNLADTIAVEVLSNNKDKFGTAKIELTLPDNAKVADIKDTYDLNNPVVIKVVGAYGIEAEYVVKIIVVPAFFEFKELWRKKASEFDFTAHNHGGIAISENYIIPHTRAGFKYYNVSDGSLAGVMSWEGCDFSPFPLHITSDDVGHIFSCNFTPKTNDELRMYMWDNVKAEPKLLFKWVSDVPGQIGRKIYVKGNTDELAYVYLTVSNNPMFLRWEVKKGKVTSETPDKVNFTHPNTTWGLQAKLVPTAVGKKSNYFINTESPNVHITYMDGNTNSVLYNSNNISWLGSSHQIEYIELDRYKYLFMTEANNWNGFTEIFGITNLINDPKSITDVNEIVLDRKWGDWWPVDPQLGDNGNTTGDIKALVAKDKQSAIVAYLVTNVGVKVYKVEVK